MGKHGSAESQSDLDAIICGGPLHNVAEQRGGIMEEQRMIHEPGSDQSSPPFPPPPNPRSYVSLDQFSVEELQSAAELVDSLESINAVPIGVAVPLDMATEPTEASEKEVSTPVFVSQTQENMIYSVIGCINGSLYSSLPEDALASFFVEEWDSMWNGDALELDLLLVSMFELSFLSDQVVLTTFAKLEEQAHTFPLPIDVPQSMLDELRGMRQSKYSRSSQERSRYDSQIGTQTKDFDLGERVQEISLDDFKTFQSEKRSFRGIVLCSLAVICLLGYALTFFFSGEKMLGKTIAPTHFTKLIPVQEMRLNKETLYIKVKPSFLKYTGAQRARLMFKIKKLATKHHGASAVVLLGSNRQMLAQIGR